MGEEVEGTSTEAPNNTIRDYYNKLCAYMLSIGMTYEQFWDENPLVCDVNHFIEAEKIRQQKLNNQMWLQGIYFRQAIASCIDKNAKYPRSPIPLTEEEQEREREQREIAFKNKLIAMSTRTK